MNHYEELGLRPDASAEEIRQAYKSVVRLLHPDAQQNESLKALAELQLKRLNGIASVLTDPRQRQAYDRTLRDLAPVPTHVRRTKDRLQRMPGTGNARRLIMLEYAQTAASYWFRVMGGEPNEKLQRVAEQQLKKLNDMLMMLRNPRWGTQSHNRTWLERIFG